MTIILITVLGAIASLIIGSVWYSDKTPMGRLHMRSMGFDKLSPDEQKAAMEKGKKMMGKLILGQFILSLFTSFFLAYITVVGITNGETIWMVFGYAAMAWFAFVIPVVGSNLLWGSVKGKTAWQKFFSDIANFLITFIIIVLIAKLFV